MRNDMIRTRHEALVMRDDGRYGQGLAGRQADRKRMVDRRGWVFTRLENVQGVFEEGPASHILCCSPLYWIFRLRLGSTIVPIELFCSKYSLFSPFGPKSRTCTRQVEACWFLQKESLASTSFVSACKFVDV
jgi:hypothetical protein